MDFPLVIKLFINIINEEVFAMTQGSATLVLDLGNSETRGIVLFGRDMTTGNLREKSFTLSNRFEAVDDDFAPSSDYNEDTSTVMNINAKVNGEDFCGTFVNGEVQLKEFNTAPMRPSATEKKYRSATTALSFELAILYGMKAIRRMMRASSLDSLDITWDVVTLLPPGDIDFGREDMVNLIKSVTEVDCTFPAIKMPIKLNRITVLPEGFCAYIGAVYDRGRLIRPNMDYLLKETTLVFDIGAGTTDILIIQDNKIIDSSKHTINRGGNNVTQLVKKALRAEGIVLNETAIANGVITGKIKDGAREVDITSVVDKARSEIAKYLVSDMQGYLEETEFPIRSIGRILVCGGGAMHNENNADSVSLGEAIVTYLKKLSPYVELVELPEHEVTKTDTDGVMSKVMEKVSPRELNILGASVLAEMF